MARLRNFLSLSVRNFSTSSLRCGKRNFRQFPLYNFRGDRAFKKFREETDDPDFRLHTYGVREPGYVRNKKFHLVPEMIPELIVPDLTGFTLKPYVSYRTSDVYQSEFTARDLFDAIYSKKITDDFAKGQLDEEGNPLEPNIYESMTADEAKILARKTGSDIFG